MRQWLCKIICRNTTEGEGNGRMEAISMDERIRDIRRRIDEQKARIAYSETQSGTTIHNESIPSETQVVEQVPKTKDTELNDLKAKLLGKKR